MRAQAIKWQLASLVVLGLGAMATGVACGSLGDALLDAECFSESDCGPLTCVRPIPPDPIPTSDGDRTNITGLGWCREVSTCAVGEQPFCTCTLNASSKYECTTSGDFQRQVPATIPCLTGTNGTCFCVPSDLQCTHPANE